MHYGLFDEDDYDYSSMDHGTGLTNFDPEDIATYEEAIRLYDEQASPQDKGRFFISKESMPNSCKGFYSCHRNYSLTEEDSINFWKIFDKVNEYLPTKVKRMLDERYPKA